MNPISAFHKPMSMDERLEAFLKGQEELGRNISKLYESVLRLEQITRTTGQQIERLMNRPAEEDEL